MNIYSVEIATNVAFGYPTMVFGRMGSGKLYVAKEAIKLLNMPTVEIDFYELRNERMNYVPDFNGPLNRRSNKMQQVDALIASMKPEPIILYTCIEYAHCNPSWMMHMFQQMMSRKVIAVGENFAFKPIVERCKVMEM